MTGWNHRVLAFQHNEEIYFKVHEVYYDSNDIPNSYAESATTIEGDGLKSLKWINDRIADAFKKPILYGGAEFPKECNIRYKCPICGRDKFTQPTPHKCKGGFRKRNINFQIILK
jgi:hypothetical protein